MMNKPVCKTYFRIDGKFKLDTISEMLKIKNTDGHNIGDVKKYGKDFYEWASWEYGTEYEATFEADKQIEKIVETLWGKIDIIREINEKYGCKSTITQIPKIIDRQTPALAFSSKIIEFCFMTGSEIEIDLYSS